MYVGGLGKSEHFGDRAAEGQAPPPHIAPSNVHWAFGLAGYFKISHVFFYFAGPGYQLPKKEATIEELGARDSETLLDYL